MILKMTKTTIFLFLSINFNSLSQNSKEMGQLIAAFPTDLTKKNKISVTEPTTEIQMVFNGLFKFYKNIFSNQDSKRCNFHPSCSEYGIQSIKSIGVFGIFHTFDRLTRCNGLNRNQYPILADRGVFYDPVKPDSSFYQTVGKIIQE